MLAVSEWVHLYSCKMESSRAQRVFTILRWEFISRRNTGKFESSSLEVKAANPSSWGFQLYIFWQESLTRGVYFIKPHIGELEEHVVNSWFLGGFYYTTWCLQLIAINQINKKVAVDNNITVLRLCSAILPWALKASSQLRSGIIAKKLSSSHSCLL